jgi:predicted RecA/RadA family phage recombinase
MATAKFIHDGDSINYTPTSADVAAGDVIVQGDLVGIAKPREGGSNKTLSGQVNRQEKKP